MFRKRLTLKIFLFLIFTDILETVTQYCFKRGALGASTFEISGLGALISFLKVVFSSPFLWIGLLSVLATFIIWSTILSKIDLSVAVPIASFSYILVPLVCVFTLHEKISILRWLGIFLILGGVIVVSLSSKEKEEKP